MAVDTGSQNVLDYSADINLLISALSDIKTSIDNLPNYTTQLDKIGNSLENIEIKLTDANALSEDHNNIISEIRDINLIVKALLQDPTLGVNVKFVDLPYQGLYARAMSRMTLTDVGEAEKLKKSVKEEQVSPMFKEY